MKNLLFTLFAFIAFSNISIANTLPRELRKDITKVTFIKSENLGETTCCTRRGRASNGQSVVITACVKSTNDIAIDVGNACTKAEAVVKANIKLLETMAP